MIKVTVISKVMVMELTTKVMAMNLTYLLRSRHLWPAACTLSSPNHGSSTCTSLQQMPEHFKTFQILEHFESFKLGCCKSWYHIEWIPTMVQIHRLSVLNIIQKRTGLKFRFAKCETFHQEQGGDGWQHLGQLQRGHDRHLKQANLHQVCVGLKRYQLTPTYDQIKLAI